MSCKIHIIQPIEIKNIFTGTLAIFEFHSSKNKLAKAKQNCLKELLSINGLAALQEEIKYDHHSLLNYPEISLSISHTVDVGIIAMAKAPHHKSIGVDIEWKDRPISSGTKKYFVNSCDIIDKQDDLLDFWTKKEAAFKAYSPINPKCRLLKDIVISESKFKFKNTSNNLGTVKSFNFKIGNKIATISIAMIN